MVSLCFLRQLTVAVVLGIIFFGVVSDKLGRKPGMFLTSSIIVIFLILCASSAGPTPQVLINCLIAFRFFLGKSRHRRLRKLHWPATPSAALVSQSRADSRLWHWW